ncbi:MAG: DUF308 domain-containing protein [Propionibacteriaceae bacterium]|nr:DUF308 domain-containing protein [Propionibacteriaceae bacterium]
MTEQNPRPGDEQPHGDQPPSHDQPYAPPSFESQPDAQGHGQQAYPEQQPDPQQYGQPQYGQEQYGQQQYGNQQYADGQYGQQYPPPAYGQQQQQQYGQQNYPQDQYAPYTYQQQWPAEPERSKTLGVVGLGIVAVCTVVFVVVGYLLGQAFGQLILDYGIEALENPDPSDPLMISFAQSVEGLTMAGAAATLTGIAGWIVSIIATARRQGRRFAIWGIIIGVLAPIIGMIAMVAGMLPAAQMVA